MVKAVAKKVEAPSKEAAAGTSNKWLNFLKSFRAKFQAENPGKIQKDVFKEAGALWKAMSEAEQNKYAKK